MCQGEAQGQTDYALIMLVVVTKYNKQLQYNKHILNSITKFENMYMGQFIKILYSIFIFSMHQSFIIHNTIVIMTEKYSVPQINDALYVT